MLEAETCCVVNLTDLLAVIMIDYESGRSQLCSINFAGALTYVIAYLVTVTKPVTGCRRIKITHRYPISVL